MTQIVEALHITPYEPIPGRIRWTQAQCDAIQEAGVLEGRYELIDGEIISKMPVNPPHSVTLVALCAWLVSVFGVLFVRQQTAIDVGEADPDHNAPQPDAAVTIASNLAYGKRHPAPADLVMVAEVSDATLRLDITAKAALYALAGIREYWIVDITGRQVIIHRQPTSSGYKDVTLHASEAKIATLAHPDKTVLVSDLLPLLEA